jgi:hypothetical protein
MAIAYLLYERRHSTDVTGGFKALAQERHDHFHTKLTGRPFTDCPNEICSLAAQVLADAAKSECEISPLTVELMRDYRFNINPVAGPGGMTYFVKLLEPGQVDPAMVQQQNENIARVKAAQALQSDANPTRTDSRGPRLIIP